MEQLTLNTEYENHVGTIEFPTLAESARPTNDRQSIGLKSFVSAERIMLIHSITFSSHLKQIVVRVIIFEIVLSN